MSVFSLTSFGAMYPANWTARFGAAGHTIEFCVFSNNPLSSWLTKHGKHAPVDLGRSRGSIGAGSTLLIRTCGPQWPAR